MIAALFSFMGWNFSSEDIKNVVEELKDKLKGAKIQSAHQPSRDDIYIEVFFQGVTSYLLISIENGFNRIYLTSKKPSNPLVPFSFQMLLRKYLVPSYIIKVEQINDDRVVMISTDEHKIYAELMGRHSNIFLTDAQDIILGSLKVNLSQRRPLFTSFKYIPPFKVGSSSTPSIEIPDRNNISEFYSNFYDKLITEYRMKLLKTKIINVLNNQERHYVDVLKKIELDRIKASRYNDYLKYAEILKQNRIISLLPNVAVCQYYTESGIATENIPLMKGTDIKANMEYYFRLYKKYKNSLSLIDKRMDMINRRIEDIRRKKSIAQSLDDITSLESLVDMGVDMREEIRVNRTGRSEGCRNDYPFKIFFVEGVGRIYSGSNDEENEILTFKFSKGNDLWFHVVGYKGSHTVLPLERGKIPSERQILTAALVAAARSSAPDGESVEVAYTRVKYVRKNKQGGKGCVIFSNEKRLYVKVDKKFPSTLIQIS
ncbi:MAG: NFACT RNA binding domain-containing protein [Deltaproteobacteria bacterium]|nr:NFACT RNA binding domain-containing protein [Deltaproteobacteria bacterium]